MWNSNYYMTNNEREKIIEALRSHKSLQKVNLNLDHGVEVIEVSKKQKNDAELQRGFKYLLSACVIGCMRKVKRG